jgi:orotidine-5'-phosphate decarboxylase
MTHFADRLLQACESKGAPVCVGIDPVLEKLPAPLRVPGADVHQAADAIRQFVEGVIDAVADLVPCVKFQSACFERYLWPGVEVYHRMIELARQRGLVVIGDAKRGDIGISAEHYAAGNLGDHVLPGSGLGPDALTLNSYLGGDSVQPFIDLSVKQGKGLFALVRTSNPGGDAIQGLALRDGGTVADAVAKLVAQWGDASVGGSGYSLLGAVVGATKPQDALRLRKLMPRQIFLVPGFGAQGGTADDVRACFNPDKRGAIITASRSVLFAFDKKPGDWKRAIADAAVDLKQQVRAILA